MDQLPDRDAEIECLILELTATLTACNNCLSTLTLVDSLVERRKMIAMVSEQTEQISEITVRLRFLLNASLEQIEVC